MHIAYISEAGKGCTDASILRAVEALSRQGFRLAGTVADGRSGPLDHPCDMDLRVLPDGASYRISQSLGNGSTGCRLAPDILEALAVDVETSLSGADILVVNKFGKLEAMGRGLRPVIVQAVEMNMPVLVGVNGLNLPGFLSFCAGMALPLKSEPDQVLQWAGRSIEGNSLSAA